MDRAKWIASCAQSEEDRILLARVYERIEQGMMRSIPTSTCFLSPRKQTLSERLLRGAGLTEFAFFGGDDSAERVVCVHLPDYCDASWLTGEDSPLTAFRADYFAGDRLTHRDFLGSLMGCGVKRETVGDIRVAEGSCEFVVLREIAPYIRHNLISAGRTKLSVSEIPLCDWKAPELRSEMISDTVATLRLDSVVASGFRLSRGKATELIEAGRASLNNLPCLKPDKQVAEDDRISLQGFGKIRLDTVRGTTKKGRIALTLERFC